MPATPSEFDIHARTTINIAADQVPELEQAAHAAGHDNVADLLQHNEELWWDSADWTITVTPATGGDKS